MKWRMKMNEMEIEMDKMEPFLVLSILDILTIWNGQNVQKWAFQTASKIQSQEKLKAKNCGILTINL